MQSAGMGVEDGGRNLCKVKNPSIRLLEPRSPALVVMVVVVGGGGGVGWLEPIPAIVGLHPGQVTSPS